MSIISDFGRLRQESRSSSPLRILTELEVSMGSMESCLKTKEKEKMERKMFIEDNGNHHEHPA